MIISQLYIHPIKSAAAVEVQEINYTATGPAYDRAWMVVDAKGVFLTQRTVPRMCLITALPNANNLTLSAVGMPTIIAKSSNTIREVTVWEDTVDAVDCGNDAANWLSQFLDTPCRLVRTFENTNRLVDTEFAQSGETVGFADGFPTLLVSQASLDEFNRQLKSQVKPNTAASTPNGDVAHHALIDMRRFRPNIVVSGCTPYAEDQWRGVRINDIEFDLVKPCSRCIMPSINPDTGDKEMHVNQTLLTTRRRDRKTFFGQNALHRGTGLIRVGDTVDCL